jgi:hypothetical protein
MRGVGLASGAAARCVAVLLRCRSAPASRLGGLALEATLPSRTPVLAKHATLLLTRDRVASTNVRCGSIAPRRSPLPFVRETRGCFLPDLPRCRSAREAMTTHLLPGASPEGRRLRAQSAAVCAGAKCGDRSSARQRRTCSAIHG